MEASKLTPEQRQKFEHDFAHFCAYSGLDVDDWDWQVRGVIDWAKWAYYCGKGL
jgi:hypothetical protein